MKKNRIHSGGIEQTRFIRNINNFFRFTKVDLKLVQQRIIDFYRGKNNHTVQLKSLTGPQPKIKDLNSKKFKKFKNMSTLRNNVQLIGRLGKNPEVKHLESGKVVANFSMATNDTYKNSKGEKVIETQWHNIVAWGKTAELIERFLQKGDEIAAQGKLTHRSYEDKEGITRYVTEVVVYEFVKMSKMPQPQPLMTAS